MAMSFFPPFEAALLLHLSSARASFHQCMTIGLDHTELAPYSICPVRHMMQSTLWLQDTCVAAWPTDRVSHVLAYACMHGIA